MEQRTQLLAVPVSVICQGAVMRSLPSQPRSQTFPRQISAEQSQRDAIADKGIDESGSVPHVHHISIYRPWRVKDQRRGAHHFAGLLPIVVSNCQRRVQSENGAQFRGGIGAHHSADVYGVSSDRLDAAISAGKEI